MVAAFVMGMLLVLQSHNRFDIPHLAPSVILGMLAIAAAGACTTGAARFLNVTVVFALAAFAVLTLGPESRFQRGADCLLGRADSACVGPNPSQQAVIDYVDSHVPAAEPVFVGNARHDRIYINDVSLYFFMRRPVPIKWSEMHPGVVNTEDVQRRMIDQLEAASVGYVVLFDAPQSRESNRSSLASDALLLDRHLRDRFMEVFSHGKYRVLQRRQGWTASR